MKRKGNKNETKKWIKILIYNILSLLILLFLFNLSVSKNKGYNWMWHKLLSKNLEKVKKLKNLSIAERHEMKQGFYFKYLDFINSKTPEDAIILIPTDSIIDLIDDKYKLKALKDRRKTTYFLYPRRAVYEKDKQNDSAYLNKITHIPIINYHGYEKLNYEIKDKAEFALIPVTQNQLIK